MRAFEDNELSEMVKISHVIIRANKFIMTNAIIDIALTTLIVPLIQFLNGEDKVSEFKRKEKISE
ncbi:unnamed protein product, partial [Dovyalis caffra]